MKRPIALMLISIMVLMLSAFSFADVDSDYSLEIKAPNKNIVVTDWDEPFFITVWVTAKSGDILENLEVIVEDEDGEEVWQDDDDFNFEFVENTFKYRFNVTNFDEIGEFTIRSTASIQNDEDDLVIIDANKDVTVSDFDEDFEEEMDNDMYPAAPAVANKLLKEAGIPNRVGTVNLIAAVAKEFDGVKKDHEDFADKVEEFLVDELNKIFDVNYDELKDFDNEFADSEKPNMKSEENKIKVKVSDVEDEDDDEDDDDDDDDDDEEKEEKAPKPEKNKK